MELSQPNGQAVATAKSDGKGTLKIVRFPVIDDPHRAMMASAETMTAAMDFIPMVNLKVKALHDETAAFAEETEAARAAARPASGFDPYSFTIAFKGVFLEGLEVAFIVLTFGANQHRIPLAALAAGLAIAVVAAAGVAVRAPLARVPENAMKFAVGVMLTSFGTFWGAEGAGAHWPGGDAALLVIIPAVLALAACLVVALRRRGAGGVGTGGTSGAAGAGGPDPARDESPVRA